MPCESLADLHAASITLVLAGIGPACLTQSRILARPMPDLRSSTKVALQLNSCSAFLSVGSLDLR